MATFLDMITLLDASFTDIFMLAELNPQKYFRSELTDMCVDWNMRFRLPCNCTYYEFNYKHKMYPI